MMEKHQGKYRIPSNRLNNWDYSSPGYYFITLYTHNRVPFFGEIVNGDLRFSLVGEIAAKEWLRTEQVRSNVSMDAWVIMPNHIHGIIMILKSDPSVVETPRRGVSISGGNPKWKPNSLGSIVNQYKSVCTKRIWAAGFPDFAWQSRFYDHIIRDQNSLNNIRAYIAGNQLKWEIDEYYCGNLGQK